jgi:hypothetical protein
MRRALTLAALLMTFTACTRLTPEQQVASDAAVALGGRDRVLAVKTLTLEGGGTQYNIGQDLRPDASGQTFTVTAYRRAVDLAGGRMRLELTRVPNFAYFQGRAPQKQVQGLDGALGFNVGANGTATRIGDNAAADRRAEWSQHPLLAVRAPRAGSPRSTSPAPTAALSRWPLTRPRSCRRAWRRVSMTRTSVTSR